MALDNNATLIVSGGDFYTAPVGTSFPDDLDAIPSAWEKVGHTSLDDILSFESEGGDATVVGTLQNPSLRVRYSARTESWTFNLQQFDVAGLRLFYGSNAAIVDGLLQVPATPTPTTAAFLIVFRDQGRAFPIYAPKTEILRGDNLEISDTESLASLPIKVTPLQYGANTWTYALKPITTP